MKRMFKIILILSIAVFAKNNLIAQTKTGSALKTSTINTEKSEIGWLGKKVIGEHSGKLKLKSGSIKTKNGILAGGDFIIDMNSITCTDLTDADYNKKLIGHLTSEDFFNIAVFPTATMKITKVMKLTKKVNEYNLTANLTIKGISNSITFPATFKKVGNGFEGNAKITIDRTKWGIKYGSSSFVDGLGDKAIKNEIELDVNIVSL